MGNIIGRDSQIETLNTALASNQSEFVAVVGRRRIGKTFLIKSFFEEDICFYVTGVQNQPMKTQLQAFANELRFRSKRFIGVPKNWLEAFAMLRDYVETVETKKRKLFFWMNYHGLIHNVLGFYRFLLISGTRGRLGNIILFW